MREVKYSKQDLQSNVFSDCVNKFNGFEHQTQPTDIRRGEGAKQHSFSDVFFSVRSARLGSCRWCTAETKLLQR